MQDSESDWEKEAAQMARVYGNAYLTIAASAARNCHSGEPEPEAPECLIQVRQPRHRNGYPDTTNPEQVAPLEGRGWAFQEYLLSPLVLHLQATKGYGNAISCCRVNVDFSLQW